MGMDVYGKHGNYFRNNVWYWRPLWGYCCEAHPNLVGDEPELGHHNDGYGLDAVEATILGIALLADITNGVIAEHVTEWYKHIARLPLHDCQWCNATGIRTDQVGIDMGMPDRPLEDHVAIILGRDHGWCNACEGSGKIADNRTNYSFSEENVREFANFLIESGGFEIC